MPPCSWTDYHLLDTFKSSKQQSNQVTLHLEVSATLYLHYVFILWHVNIFFQVFLKLETFSNNINASTYLG